MVLTLADSIHNVNPTSQGRPFSSLQYLGEVLLPSEDCIFANYCKSK